MNKYYIQSSKNGEYYYFDNIKDLVGFLKTTFIPKEVGQTKEQYIQHLIDLGHGYDDIDGVMITRALSESFNIGVFRNNMHVRTDIHAASKFTKNEYGD